MFLCMSFVQVNANHVNANVDKEMQDPEPTSDLVWKSAMGSYNLNIPEGTRIDYLFKFSNEWGIKLFGVKISGNWGGTSCIEPILKKPYNFIKGEYYEVRMLFTNIISLREINEKPYISPGDKLMGSGYGIKIYQ